MSLFVEHQGFPEVSGRCYIVTGSADEWQEGYNLGWKDCLDQKAGDRVEANL